MRRPLKPFVTEYKGARRPASNQSPVFDASQDTGLPGEGVRGFRSAGADSQRRSWPSDFDATPSDRPRPRPVEFAAAPDSEDAYEAAMRAADALFTRPDAVQPTSEPIGQPTLEPNAGQGEHIARERGGRILPVIDEAPPPQFAALEAAYAPKRRGRKPGSKNKPKPALPDTDKPTSDPHPQPEPQHAEPIEYEASRVVGDRSAAPIQTLEAIRVSGAGDSPRGSRRVARAAHGRVKPGEGWKRRRLPRICW